MAFTKILPTEFRGPEVLEVAQSVGARVKSLDHRAKVNRQSTLGPLNSLHPPQAYPDPIWVFVFDKEVLSG